MMQFENDPKQNIEDHVNMLNYHNHLYHVLNKPEIDDITYDQLYRRLLELEEKFPEYVLPNSPTRQIGAPVGSGAKINRHYQPLLSLGNIFNQDELLSWMVGIKGALVTAEYKLDGLALSLTYRNRKLIYATTRGDGTEGEDVTRNVVDIRNIPWELPNTYPDIEFEIHGEVYITHENFNRINAQQREQGLDEYINPRNAAAGYLRRIYRKPGEANVLTFSPYGSDDRLIDALNIDNYYQLMDYFHLSFNVATNVMFCETLAQVQQYYEAVDRERQEIPFDIDGVVIKVVNINKRRELGFRTREPRWAVAYKFVAAQATTTLETVKWQTGRTGNITPVAIFESVNLSGANIRQCTLHNVAEIHRLGVRIGSEIVVARRGDVIPKIMSAQGGVEDIAIPTHCPTCEDPVAYDEGEPKCYNPNCIAKLATYLQYFCSRDCFDIDGVGERVAEELISTGLVENYADLLALHQRDPELIMSVTSLRDKGVANLQNAIRSRLEISFDRFLASLGIPQTGRTAGKLVASEIGSMEALLDALATNFAALESRLLSIKGMGPISVAAFMSYFMKIENIDLYKRACSYGLVVKPVTVEKSTGEYEGMSFVVTGSFKNVTREALTEALKAGGATVTSKVTKNTTALIRGGEIKGSKFNDAVKLGVRIDTFDAPNCPTILLTEGKVVK